MNQPIFIFMLTRNDSTIPDALDKVKEVLSAGIKHIGFKDIGLPFEQLQALSKAIRDGGGTVYLEVVSLDEESEVNSAKIALDLEVDVLMGGTRPEKVLPIIKGTNIHYYPFAGKISGHPSVLEGSIDEIVINAQHNANLEGVSGLDLLAYRFKGDVPALIKNVCSAVNKPIYIAGSIDSKERIEAVVKGNAVGFTVGTAALDEVFQTEKKGLAAQIKTINNLIKEAL
ncbi:hypothetical protein [Aeromonas sp. MdU4]|uniref:hypothetical protein n=1 Tax=Aeromonas sp. MdU4 TaxID=3342819 RepID=UPI0035BA7E98